MSGVSRWRDSGHLERAVETAGGQDAFDASVAAMLDDARGWRLAEMRKRRGMTQEQVAARMGVSVARVSQIESGDVSTQDVLSRFVAALGGTLKLIDSQAHRRLRRRAAQAGIAEPGRAQVSPIASYRRGAVLHRAGSTFAS
jgi:DNA-binding XRE family transcriptional regulator